MKNNLFWRISINLQCPIKGVVQTPVVCQSVDKCTKTFCDPTRGCVNQPVVCDAPRGGATYRCNPTNGVCECITPSCDDNDPCTVDSFVIGRGCVNTPKCQSNNLCIVPKCDKTSGTCSYTDKNCDDGNPCTVDSCDPVLGKCINKLRSCACTAGNIGSCNTTTGQCEFRPACRTSSDCAEGLTCDPARGCFNDDI